MDTLGTLIASVSLPTSISETPSCLTNNNNQLLLGVPPP